MVDRFSRNGSRPERILPPGEEKRRNRLLTHETLCVVRCGGGQGDVCKGGGDGMKAGVKTGELHWLRRQAMISVRRGEGKVGSMHDVDTMGWKERW